MNRERREKPDRPPGHRGPVPGRSSRCRGPGETALVASRRIAITLPDETFTAVRDLALAAGTTFSEQVRRIVETELATQQRKERHAGAKVKT